MASVLPKVYLYMFISIIAVVIATGYNLMSMIANETFDVLLLISSFATGFIPFATTISLVFNNTGVPIEIVAIVGAITGLISALQIYVLSIIVENMIPFTNV